MKGEGETDFKVTCLFHDHVIFCRRLKQIDVRDNQHGVRFSAGQTVGHQ
jgi:hypothetical protein